MLNGIERHLALPRPQALGGGWRPVPLATLLWIVSAVAPLGSCGSGGGSSGLVGSSAMAVDASQDLSATGPVGGPFTPGDQTYTVSNTGTEPIAWEATTDQAWVVVSPGSGTLQGNSSTIVNASIVAVEVPPLVGSHVAAISFRNITSGLGDTTRPAGVTVTAPASGPMTTARRTSGVAPFAVVFDAVGATSGVVQPAGASPDFGTMHYQWDFGDPTSGTWAYSGKPRNTATGFIASHVYETPGTYTVQLQITSAEGTTHDYSQQITVLAANTVMANSTFYVSAAGNDSNSGLTENQAFQTASRAFAQLFQSNGPCRILFRRGDTFPMTQAISTGGRTGPYIVGAYGTGNKPLLTTSLASDGLYYAQVSDLRVVDVDFTGPNPANAGNGLVPGRDCLVLRSTVRAFRYGMLFHASSGDHSGNVVSDCEILDQGTYGIYYAAQNHFAVQGTRFDNSIGNSLLRAYVDHAVWQSNLFQRAGQSAVRIMGRSAPAVSSHVVVADNVFESTTPWVFEIGPENNTLAQYAENILIEGNRFINRAGSSSVILVFAPKVTIRNNLFDLGGAWAIDVFQRGIGPVPTGVKVYNNTAYRAGGGSLNFVQANSGDSTQVINNITFNTGGGIVTATGTVNQSNNLQTNPGFLDAPNGDFRLQSGSPAIDAGTTAPVRVDFARNARPSGSALDIGAYEFQ